jgi:hypothetical protein
MESSQPSAFSGQQEERRKCVHQFYPAEITRFDGETHYLFRRCPLCGQVRREKLVLKRNYSPPAGRGGAPAPLFSGADE